MKSMVLEKEDFLSNNQHLDLCIQQFFGEKKLQSILNYHDHHFADFEFNS